MTTQLIILIAHFCLIDRRPVVYKLFMTKCIENAGNMLIETNSIKHIYENVVSHGNTCTR